MTLGREEGWLAFCRIHGGWKSEDLCLICPQVVF
jgi:hypothetical protein